MLSRRKLIQQATAASALLLVTSRSFATDISQDFPEDLTAAIKKYTQGNAWKEHKVTFEIAELIDNGNTVPISVIVDSPMQPNAYVKSIAVFNEKNPNRDVVMFSLTPSAGKAEVATRIRLATSQRLIAIAQMSDGTYCSKTVEVIVTLASCIEVD
jgi:sulfur-oxidizing protein SoxY